MVGTNGEATIWIEMCTMCANESVPFRAKSHVNLIGDLWTEIPADILETLLHPCTTQRRVPLQ